MKNTPLVSVILISYNSSKTIINTLNSILSQKYNRVELIISDDCSNDSTINVCREWLNKHQHSFVSIKLLESNKNTGIPSNCNRGVNASSGEWVKLIAGDDILLPNCVEDLVFAGIQSKSNLIYGSGDTFSSIDNNGMVHLTGELPLNKEFHEKLSNSNIEIQQKFINVFSYLFTPSVLINKTVLMKLNSFDEEFSSFEDYPLYYKFLYNGEKVHFLNKKVVQYRVWEGSISNLSKKKDYINKKAKNERNVFNRNILNQSANLIQKIDHLWNWMIIKVVFLLGNKRNLITQSFFVLGNKLNPAAIYYKLKGGKLNYYREKYNV